MTGSDEGAAEEAPAKRGPFARLFSSRARTSTEQAPDEDAGALLDAAGLPPSLALTGDVGQDSDVETEEVELYPRRPLVRTR